MWSSIKYAHSLKGKTVSKIVHFWGEKKLLEEPFPTLETLQFISHSLILHQCLYNSRRHAQIIQNILKNSNPFKQTDL